MKDIIQGFAAGAAIALAMIYCLNAIGRTQQKPTAAVQHALHNEEAAIAAYLKKAGALYPAEVASACMETATSPALCAAMCLRESTGNIAPPNGAAGEVGPFQIIQANWSWLVGQPSRDINVAAQQWDLIMLHLQETHGSLPAAIGAYNGNGEGYVFGVWSHYKKMEAGF